MGKKKQDELKEKSSNKGEPKNKADEKDKKEKKSEISEKTLEKIVEIKKSKTKPEISEEDTEESEMPQISFNEFAKPKRSSGSLDNIAVLPDEGIRISSGWANQIRDEQKEGGGNDFEYIPKNPEGSEGKKYQIYELNSNIKMLKPEEVSSSWSKPFNKMKEAKFIRYESNKDNSKYEKVFTSKNLDEEEMRKLQDKRKMDFDFQEAIMHYYENQ